MDAAVMNGSAQLADHMPAHGDHHLVSGREIAVQPDDWGMAWEQLIRMRTNK